ncbi:MAG: alanine racemase [Candidatus Omnitrophica bacterium]|nr:alanine racemase [Candidatus Omnitrophota bacterium]
MFRPLWIEINLGALGDNFRTIKRSVGKKVKIIATVKQSAYGHGLVPVAKELKNLGVDFFGVGSLEEGISLRKAGIKSPILLLSAALAQYARYFVKYRLTPTVINDELANALNQAAKRASAKLPVHLKIDTGMGRLGYYYEDAYRFVESLRQLKNISLEGIFTHLPVADTNTSFTNYQIEIFDDFISNLEKEGVHFKYRHCANSAGLAIYPKAHFNMVRPGLILYGIKPAPNIKMNLKPILALKSKVIFVKKIKAGMGVSYGRTYIARKPTNIATVSVGYADGYPWALSGLAQVIIKNSFFKLAGRVCMDHVMVDLGDREDIAIGDEVMLIGKKGKLQISVEDLAAWAKTIPYEIVSRLSLKIPRIYRK